MNDYQAFELAGSMFIKMSRNDVVTSEAHQFFAGYQPFGKYVCVGGVTREGTDATK